MAQIIKKVSCCALHEEYAALHLSRDQYEAIFCALENSLDGFERIKHLVDPDDPLTDIKALQAIAVAMLRTK